MNKYRCDCSDDDTDDPCDACIIQDLRDEAEAAEDSREASREFWAEREADFMYDPLNRSGFE